MDIRGYLNPHGEREMGTRDEDRDEGQISKLGREAGGMSSPLWTSIAIPVLYRYIAEIC